LAKVHGEVKGLLIRVDESISSIAGLKRTTVSSTAKMVPGFHVLDDQIPDRSPIGFAGRGLLDGGRRDYPLKPVNIVKRLTDLPVDAQGVENSAKFITDMHC
jgi:hypothetical protein